MIADIELDRFPARYRPSEIVSGSVQWSFPEDPISVSICLRWRAEGKGTPDSGLAITERYGNAGASGRHEFRLALPVMPYSFSGKALSISWRVELVARRGRLAREAVEAFRIVTMSPTGDAIDPYER
jgi:hypothetical protein